MLRHADHAIVDDAKVCDYLLSDTHPVGRFKARVFRSLGYTVESWIRLRDDLLHHGQIGTVQSGLAVIPDHSNQPRLITEFPEVSHVCLAPDSCSHPRHT